MDALLNDSFSSVIASFPDTWLPPISQKCYLKLSDTSKRDETAALGISLFCPEATTTSLFKSISK